jgi:hypothetical protein
MGDRANVCVKGEDGAVFFYTHWRGSELDALVHAGLQKELLWGDTAYLRRILFCEIIKGAHSEETGFGISSGICDNAHPIILVNDVDSTVSLATEEEPLKPFHTVTYAQFIEDPATLRYRNFDSDGKEEPEEEEED